MSRWMWNLCVEQVSWDRPEQVQDSSHVLWIERCEELLSASCRISSYWHAGEPLKLCWMSERLMGLLYFEDRSSGISLALTLWAVMLQRVEGICHQWAYRWSRGPGQAARPHQARKQGRFSAETGLIFTLRNPGMWFRTPPLPSAPHRCCEAASGGPVGPRR